MYIKKIKYVPNNEDTMREITVREAIYEAIVEEMDRDQDVFILGEDIAEYGGAYKVTHGLLNRFGSHRVIDTPISEAGFTGIAIGAAFAGLKPIVEFMTFNFAMQAIDHIVNSAAKTRYMSGGTISCPIVFRGPNGVAARVGAQHSQCYASWYGHIPGIKTIAPYSADDAKLLLKAAIRDPNPVVFLEHELMYGVKFPTTIDGRDENNTSTIIGKARIRDVGTDVSIISYSRQVGTAIDAAKELVKHGITAEVVDLRTISPLDVDTILKSVCKTGRAIVVEEGWGYANVGAEIVALLNEHAFDYLDAPIIRIAGANVPLPYASNLESMAMPKIADVVKAAIDICNHIK